jgi:ribosomal-protein-alanine N-acetyltransferase
VIPVRKTKRLLLRPLRPSDYPAWRLAADTMSEPLNRWDRKPKTPDVSRAKFREILRRQARERASGAWFSLGVFAGRELVGKVSLMNISRGLDQMGYLGYRIYNPHWGKGYGYEAAKAMIDIAFTDLGLHRVEAGVEPMNVRSIRLARKLGLRLEGRKRRAVYLRDGWRDLLAYAACCEDYGLQWRGQIPTAGSVM